MSLEVTGLARLDDGSHSGKTTNEGINFSYINSYTTTTGSTTYQASPGNIMIQGPPPMVNGMAMMMGGGGSGWPIFTSGTVVEFKNLSNTSQTFTMTVQNVNQSDPNNFMIDGTVTAVNGWPGGPPYASEMDVQTTLGRFNTNTNLATASNTLNVNDYLAYKNEKFRVTAISGTQVDVTPEVTAAHGTTPSSGDWVSKWSGHTGDGTGSSSPGDGLHGNIILEMPVKKVDNTYDYYPIIRADRIKPVSAADSFIPFTLFNSIRIGPDPANPATAKYRHIWIGDGEQLLRKTNTPNDSTNICIGTEIMSSIAFSAADALYSNMNILLGWELAGGRPDMKFKHNILMGESIFRTEREEFDYNVVIGGNNMHQGAGQTVPGVDMDYNVAIGWEAAMTLGSGSRVNVFVGSGAGNMLRDTCSQNVLIGYQAGPHQYWAGGNQGADSVLDSICIGYQSHESTWGASNEITLGNGNNTTLRCNVTTISSLSDQRDKTNIADLPDSAGLSFINALTPRVFNWDRREWYTDGFDENGSQIYIDGDGSKVIEEFDWDKPNSGLKMGFIAQELQAVLDSTDIQCLKDAKIVMDRNPDFLEAQPSTLIVPMVKAIQELSARLDALEG